MAEPLDHSAPFVRMSRGQLTLVLATFAAYVVLVIVLRQYDPRPTADWIPALVVVYVGLIAAPIFVLRRSGGWFHPVVFLSLFKLVDLLRRVTLFSWGLDWHRAIPASHEELNHIVELHLMIHSLALVSYYAGYALAPRLPVPRVRFENPRGLVPKLLMVFGFALVAFAVFIASRGGVSAHVDSWSTGRAEQLVGKHWQIALANVGIPACWIWLAMRRSALRSPLFWAACAITLAIAFLGNGSRSTMVYPAGAALMIWMLRERRVPQVRILLAAVVMIYVVTVLGTFRRSSWYGETDWSGATEAPFVDTVMSGAQGELVARSTTDDGGLAIFARVPEDVPLIYGSSYLSVIAVPIPYAIWPQKPGSIDGRVGQTFFGMRSGVPPGAVGEAYWNFHIAGIIGVFLLFGVFHRWLARVFLRYAEQPVAIVLYAACLLFFREPGSAPFVMWMLMQVPLWVILAFTGLIALGGPPRRVGTLQPSSRR